MARQASKSLELLSSAIVLDVLLLMFVTKDSAFSVPIFIDKNRGAVILKAILSDINTLGIKNCGT